MQSTALVTPSANWRAGAFARTIALSENPVPANDSAMLCAVVVAVH